MPKRNKHSSPLPPPPSDDVHLLEDLFTQLDQIQATAPAPAPAPAPPAPPKQHPKSRYDARRARKAAAITQQFPKDDPDADARLQRETDLEQSSISNLCAELDVRIHEINPDGHCLFAAIADQLSILSILSQEHASYPTTRLAASSYMSSHPNDFLPFLPAAEDCPGDSKPGIMSPTQFHKYCADIRNTGKWGGEPEIMALSRAYNVPIHVIQAGSPPIVVHNPSSGPVEQDIYDKRAVRISYHRRMYGLGEHYNSLRPKSTLSSLATSVHDLFRPS